MEINLSKWQTTVWDDTHRFIVIDAGRRCGKSTLSSLIMVNFALTNNDKSIWYVSPSYRQSEQIMWRMIMKVIPKQAILKTNDTKLKVELKNGSIIELKGADSSPDSLRGVKIDYLVLDEVASFRYWDKVWSEVLRPTLMDSQGKCLFIGTPKGYNHFWDLYNTEKEDTDFKSYKFTTYDNPSIQPDEIDKMKKEMDEDTFAQEVLGEFKKMSGLVYKDFSREKHLINPIEINFNWTKYRGIDFGFVHPSSVVFGTINDMGEIIIYDLIYQKGLLTPDLAKIIAEKSISQYFAGTWGDSAAQSDIQELQRYGISVVPVSKVGSNNQDWVVAKTRKLTELLRNNRIKIFNTKNLEPLVNEFETYQYHEANINGEVKEVPLKLNDDAINALEYMVWNIPDRIEKQYINHLNIKPYDKKKWNIA